MSARDVLLTPEEAAEELRLPVRQLQQWRYLGIGPAYVKVGRAVRYPRSDLDAWLTANRVEPKDTP
jgi:excisionase family DNA binding protein